MRWERRRKSRRGGDVLLVIVVAALYHHFAATPIVALAPPHIVSISPSFGPDSGGTLVEIRGRNLAYLRQDIKIFFGVVPAGENELPGINVGWESIQLRTPKCTSCGVVDTNVIVGKKRSNALPFMYTNECRGPRLDGERPILPPRFSGEENCTICTELLLLSTATVPDTCSWQQFVDTMSAACESAHFTNFSVPGSTCFTDYNMACKVLVTSQGDQLAGLVWKYWEMNYFSGKMIDMACAEVGRCDYSW
eukprot:g4663.t1